ncbi:MAG: ABC transporter ATP-binding protein [Mycobacterium leprae]
MVLATTNLIKRFGRTTALSGITFRVEPGELVGLVGPDGAGKTTLLRLLAGVYRPTSGDITLEVSRKRVGYLSQHFSLYPDLTVQENIAFFASVYGLHRQAIRRRSQYLLEWVGLAPFQDRLAAQLSGGMKQKLSLACALLHPTDLLLLDEPTTAVDPVSRREFWALIQELVAQGTAVIVSTPYMEEAARCHQVGLLHQGRLLAYQSPESLLARYPYRILAVQAPSSSRSALESAAMRFPGAVGCHPFGSVVHVSLRQSLTEHQQQLAAYMTGLPGLETEEVAPSLEDVFIWMLEAEGVGAC